MVKKICIVVDHPTRDLDGILILANKLTKNNFSIVIVPMYYLREIFFINPHAVIFNNCRKQYYKIFKLLNLLSIKIIILDTEGAPISKGSEGGFKKDIINAQDYYDLYFLWGEYQKKLLIRSLSKKNLNKFYVTGNSKYEVYKKKYIKYFYKKHSIYKNYILINTSFAAPFTKFQTLKKDQLEHKNPKLMMKLQNDFKKRIFIFCDYILKLARIYKKQLFVIRNHPFEDSDFYKDYFKKCKNIKVYNKENLLTQLSDCKFMIHSNCSTSIDSLLLKKNSIFVDLTKKSIYKYNTYLFKKISYFVQDFSKLNKFFIKLNSYNFRDLKYHYKAKKIDYFYKTSSNSISDNISNVIKNIDFYKQKKLNIFYLFFLYVKVLGIFFFIKDIFKLLFSQNFYHYLLMSFFQKRNLQYKIIKINVIKDFFYRFNRNITVNNKKYLFFRFKSIFINS